MGRGTFASNMVDTVSEILEEEFPEVIEKHGPLEETEMQIDILRAALDNPDTTVGGLADMDYGSRTYIRRTIQRADEKLAHDLVSEADAAGEPSEAEESEEGTEEPEEAVARGKAPAEADGAQERGEARSVDPSEEYDTDVPTQLEKLRDIEEQLGVELGIPERVEQRGDEVVIAEMQVPCTVTFSVNEKFLDFELGVERERQTDTEKRPVTTE